MDKLKDLGEITFGAGCVRSFEGKKGFDKYYVDKVVKKVVKRTGEGEDDFILIDKVIETKRDIAKEIHSQSGDAGIDGYIKAFEITEGVHPLSMPSPSVEDIFKAPINDFTKMPDSLADATLLGEKSRELFKSLPKDLVGKLTYDEFISSFTQEKFDEWKASLMPPKKEGKDEVK